MNPNDKHAELPPETPSRNLMINATVIYGGMAAIGAIVAYYRGEGSLKDSLSIALETVPLLKLLAVALLGGGVLLISNFLFEDLFPNYKNLKWALAKLMGGFSVPVATYLAFASALGEELFFRAAIQPEIGIAATSIIFGLLHLGPGGKISSWTIWTTMAGVLLGWMYHATGNLWPSILSHFIVNLVGFLRLRSLYKAAVTAAKSDIVSSPEESFRQ